MAEVKENREKMIPRSRAEVISIRADILHKSFRRFVLRESCFKKVYEGKRAIKKESDS